MMRKEKQLKTYGRHTRRIVVTDAWSDNEKKQRSVFGTSSELDSSKESLFHLSSSSNGRGGSSLNSTGNSIHTAVSRVRGNTRKQEKCAQDKENDSVVISRKPSQRLTKKTALKDQTNMVSASSSCDDIFSSTSAVKTRCLRERKKDIVYNDQSNSKVQLAATTGKRKRYHRVCKDKSPDGIIAVNFSDFDDYSLVISDSPAVESSKPSAKQAVETSTPVSKRNRYHMNDANLSHIEVCSPLTDVGSYLEPSSDRLSYSASPSIVSSEGSNVDRNVSKNQSDIAMGTRVPENAVVELERLGDSFIAATLSGGTDKKSAALQTRRNEPQVFDNSASLFESINVSKVFDNSASLFGSPSTALEANVLTLSRQLHKISFRATGETEESGDSTAEETEDDGSVEETADLSAIEEDEEDFSEDDTDSDSLESSRYANCSELENCEISTRNTRVNLQKLSDSLLTNHVSGRRTTKSSKQSCTDNDTLYMINDSSGSWSESDTEESESSSIAQSLQDDGSVYVTAQKVTDNSSEGEEDHSEDEIHTVDDEEEEETDRKVYSLRDKQLQGLQNSFKEILTPTKRTGSMVPVSAQTKVLLACDQSEPVPFKTALPHKMLSQCKKIGEGVYGEVFRSYHNSHPVAIKIIPIEGSLPVNGEPQKKFDEILPEIVIAKELSDLKDAEVSRTSNFCTVQSVWCVQGQYPAELLKQWDIFDKAKRSENDRPDVFSNSQLYILFEFADCGTALEAYKFEDLHQARSVLAQVVFALAVAEEALQFEHRDLHIGNVLVRPTKHKDKTFSMLGKHFSVPTYGVEANIIDFTLSRLAKDGCTVYSDLSTDNTLFQGAGDLQFDVYRDMKDENSNNWEPFHPHTNVLWLHYLAHKLVYTIPYPTTSSRAHRELLRHFRQFLAEIRDYNSASEMAVDSLFLNS